VDERRASGFRVERRRRRRRGRRRRTMGRREDGGTRRASGGETTTKTKTSGNGANVFDMEHLRAAVDRHHKHISNEVERAWKERSKTLGGGFSFAGGAGASANAGGALERDSDDAVARNRKASRRVCRSREPRARAP